MVKRIALSLYPGLMRSWTLHSTPVEQQDGSHLSYSKNRGYECVVTFQLNTGYLFKFLIGMLDRKPYLVDAVIRIVLSLSKSMQGL